jgi:hypothetical protein
MVPCIDRNGDPLTHKSNNDNCYYNYELNLKVGGNVAGQKFRFKKRLDNFLRKISQGDR